MSKPSLYTSTKRLFHTCASVYHTKETLPYSFESINAYTDSLMYMYMTHLPSFVSFCDLVCVHWHSRFTFLGAIKIKLDWIWEKPPLTHKDKYFRNVQFNYSMNYISRMHGAAYMQFSTVVQLSMVFQFMNSSMSS